jgi:IS605 OrfB family transposase
MHLTYEAAWYPSQEQQVIIQDQMRRFQSVKRLAFKQLQQGQKRQSIVTQVRKQGLLTNARYIRSAIEEAKALIKAQHQLVHLYCQESAWKVQQTTTRLTRYQNCLMSQAAKLTKKQSQKQMGLHARVQKAQASLVKWQTHSTQKTIPSVVFGGKPALRSYQQGKLSKKSWQRRRNNGVYCVGEQNKQGNANLRLEYNALTQEFVFSMLLDRGNRNERLTAPLFVPAKYQFLFEDLAQGQTAYTVRILFPPNGFSIRVLLTMEQKFSGITNNQGIAGIDLNPTGLAITLVHPNGNYRRSKWFPCPDLMYAQTNKRNWQIGNLIAQALEWIASHQINTVSLEALRFLKRFGTNHSFNRLKSNFVYRKLIHTIQAQALRSHMTIKEVNPAYTSVVGQIKYQRCYGLNTHQAAALVIARRGLGLNEKLYAHINGHQQVLVVPPMEGWSHKQSRWFTREKDEFTAHLSKLTSKVQGDPPRLIPRRQGSGGGIIPRSHTLTPGLGAPVP